MKYLVILVASGWLFCSCGQGESREDNARGEDGQMYTDEGTTDSTRLGSDTVTTHPGTNHIQ